jgi:ParB-like chromosome segregation protein Spo0J
MREGGWQGSPIDVAAHEGSLYIIDGHHRVAAAKRAGIDVPYRVMTMTQLRDRGWTSIEDIVSAFANTRPDRLR